MGLLKQCTARVPLLQAQSLGNDIAKNVPTKEDVPNLGGGDLKEAGGQVKRAAEKVGDALPGTGGRSFP